MYTVNVKRLQMAGLQIVIWWYRSFCAWEDIEKNQRKLLIPQNAGICSEVNPILFILNVLQNSSDKKQEVMYLIDKIVVPFHTPHVDHLWKFILSNRGNKYLLVVVDGFTKYLAMKPVKNTSKNVVRILLGCFYLFRMLRRIIFGRGTAFTVKMVALLCKNYGSKHILNQCERYNKTILNALATSNAGQTECMLNKCKQLQSAKNCSFNKVLNCIPTEALAGYKVKQVAKAWLLNEVQVDLECFNLQKLRSKTVRWLNEDQQRRMMQFNKTRANARQYHEGDWY